MRPSQKELNEFVLDLVEFMGKHFASRFDKTRVAGGNEGVSIRIRRASSGSELEITTDRMDPFYEFGSVHWHFHPYAGSKEALFERMLSDLSAVFSDRIVAINGFQGERVLGGRAFWDTTDAEAVRLYREAHPECDKLTLKKWSEPGQPFFR
jgi:hypothetical protein